MPDELLRAVALFELPRRGAYGVLMCFLPMGGRRVGVPKSCSSGRS